LRSHAVRRLIAVPMLSRAGDIAGHTPETTAPALDREALEALDRGDHRQAVTHLMRAYGDAIHRYCRCVLRDRVMADDVHQTVFVQAYEDMESFSRRSSLRAWLYAIARHRCLDALKVNARRGRRFALLGAVPDEPDRGVPSDEAIASRSLAIELDACLGGLLPQVREAVLLRYGEGFTYEEMARICRERPPTLQARVARALPALRRCLESRGVEP